MTQLVPTRQRFIAVAAVSRSWRLTMIGIGLIVGSGCASDSADPALAQGRELYEANCASCHGETALGDGSLASTLPVPPPGLMEHLGHHSEAELFRLIRDGVPPAMPPTPLEDEEIGLIVDYLWTLVPEAEVADLRAMQQHMEMMSDSAAGSMPGMQTAPTTTSADTPAMHMQH